MDQYQVVRLDPLDRGQPVPHGMLPFRPSGHYGADLGEAVTLHHLAAAKRDLLLRRHQVDRVDEGRLLEGPHGAGQDRHAVKEQVLLVGAGPHPFSHPGGGYQCENPGHDDLMNPLCAPSRQKSQNYTV